MSASGTSAFFCCSSREYEVARTCIFDSRICSWTLGSFSMPALLAALASVSSSTYCCASMRRCEGCRFGLTESITSSSSFRVITVWHGSGLAGAAAALPLPALEAGFEQSPLIVMTGAFGATSFDSEDCGLPEEGFSVGAALVSGLCCCGEPAAAGVCALGACAGFVCPTHASEQTQVASIRMKGRIGVGFYSLKVFSHASTSSGPCAGGAACHRAAPHHKRKMQRDGGSQRQRRGQRGGRGEAGSGIQLPAGGYRHHCAEGDCRFYDRQPRHPLGSGAFRPRPDRRHDHTVFRTRFR